MRDIDSCDRVIGGDPNAGARGKATERRLHLEDRKRAAKAARVDVETSVIHLLTVALLCVRRRGEKSPRRSGGLSDAIPERD
jgi:hypothetical protein